MNTWSSLLSPYSEINTEEQKWYSFEMLRKKIGYLTPEDVSKWKALKTCDNRRTYVQAVIISQKPLRGTCRGAQGTREKAPGSNEHRRALQRSQVGLRETVLTTVTQQHYPVGVRSPTMKWLNEAQLIVEGKTVNRACFEKLGYEPPLLGCP